MYEQVNQGQFGRLDVMHHILSGIKSLCTEEVIKGIDIARRSAGGAGYLAGAGFVELMELASPAPTFEGDNTVMLLQSSRYVFKMIKKVKKGQQLEFPFTYISDAKDLISIKGKGKSIDELLDIDLLCKAVAVRALVLVFETEEAIEKSTEPDTVKDNELFSRMKIDMVRAHNEQICAAVFKRTVEQTEIKDSRIRPILQDLLRIFLLTLLSQSAGALYQCGFFDPSANKFIKLALDQLIAKIRPQLIPLVESYTLEYENFPTSIGNYYGDIYET